MFLSKNSPLGVPFHYLKGTSSDIEKQKRIEQGNSRQPMYRKAFGKQYRIYRRTYMYCIFQIPEAKNKSIAIFEFARKAIRKRITNGIGQRMFMCRIKQFRRQKI